MSFLYFDCFSGISGDMIIAALLDAGASFENLSAAIDGLDISAHLEHTTRSVQGIRSSSFSVSSAAAPLRHLRDIQSILEASPLPTSIKSKSLEVFRRLAAAEAQVHGIEPDEVHFHEIGAVDTIVDVVGTFVCMDSLGVKQSYVSALPWSGGITPMEHGRYPLPAPATAILLTDYPCFFSDVGMELITPTGAVLVTSIASPLIDGLDFVPKRIAYGAGNFVRKDGVPNLLRVILADESQQPGQGTIAILETEVDDLSPEIFTHLHDLFQSDPAVLDFFTTPIFMKKNRPGHLISVLTRPAACSRLCQVIMRETGSLGVRYRQQKRIALDRRETLLTTPWGEVRLKTANLGDGTTRSKPEYEDCHRIALEYNLPLIDVLSAVNRLAGGNS
ncbi:MAG: nickel pincer cofactor biosynthesis protein LarC [Syntrophomonadaceae bacterium]